jgi:hypothetical protein
MEAYFARQAQTPAAPRLKVSNDSSGATEIAPDHPDPPMGLSLLAEAFATTDVSFVVGLICQLADVGTRRGKVGERELNFMLAVVKGAKPKDQMEAMLAAQMAAVHMATMALARRLANVDNIAKQDSAERAFNKLARTFAAQAEALKRYRSRGGQTVRVEHVTVNEGGQCNCRQCQPWGEGLPWKRGDDPMNRYSFQKAPRCSATSKRTRERCKAPAVRGWTVCRFHGARGGGPRGKRNGMYRHGLSKKAIKERRVFW